MEQLTNLTTWNFSINSETYKILEKAYNDEFLSRTQFLIGTKDLKKAEKVNAGGNT